jgi:hypothetical protein
MAEKSWRNGRGAWVGRSDGAVACGGEVDAGYERLVGEDGFRGRGCTGLCGGCDGFAELGTSGC